MNNQQELEFAAAMKRVEYLREAKAQDLEKRDRAEFDWLMRFASGLAFFKKQV